jgi:hypothetical protein
MILIASVATGCPSQTPRQDERALPPMDGYEHSWARMPDDDGPAETWVAILDHGHGPGNGYELTVRNQQIVDGTFYLLDPGRPHDLASAGQAAPFENTTASTRQATFSITLQSGAGKYQDTLTITLVDSLSGNVGNKARATVKSQQPDTESQDLVFERLK